MMYKINLQPRNKKHPWKRLLAPGTRKLFLHNLLWLELITHSVHRMILLLKTITQSLFIPSPCKPLGVPAACKARRCTAGLSRRALGCWSHVHQHLDVCRCGSDKSGWGTLGNRDPASQWPSGTPMFPLPSEGSSWNLTTFYLLGHACKREAISCQGTVWKKYFSGSPVFLCEAALLWVLGKRLPFPEGVTATQGLRKSEFEQKIFLLPPLYSWGRLGLAAPTNAMGMQCRDKKNQNSFLKSSLPPSLHCQCWCFHAVLWVWMIQQGKFSSPSQAGPAIQLYCT